MNEGHRVGVWFGGVFGGFWKRGNMDIDLVCYGGGIELR